MSRCKQTAGLVPGIWRKFLGLKSGHTYKLEIRVNTLNMDTNDSNWSFSVHAAYDDTAGSLMTVDQFTDSFPLADGSEGTGAGQFALFGPKATTRGEWLKCSTDIPPEGKTKSNIKLPENVTSITVWLRLTGANCSGVGMDWIRLEDMGE